MAKVEEHKDGYDITLLSTYYVVEESNTSGFVRD